MSGVRPEQISDDLKSHQAELSIEARCLLRGMRVVVPGRHRSQVLKELHASHPGIVSHEKDWEVVVWYRPVY